MTEADIRTAWTRYMHRTDLVADLDLAWAFAVAKIRSRLMRRDVDLDAILLSDPQVFLHGGMTYLQELAMDDEGLARESALFDSAIGDHAMRWSIDNSDATATLYGGRLAP